MIAHPVSGALFLAVTALGLFLAAHLRDVNRRFHACQDEALAPDPGPLAVGDEFRAYLDQARPFGPREMYGVADADEGVGQLLADEVEAYLAKSAKGEM